MNEAIEIGEDYGYQPITVKLFQPSQYQQAIFDWIKQGSGDAIVNAVAGSGKTTTLVEASKLLPANASAMFCAFNAHIVTTLKARLDGMECATIHSLGLRTLAAHLGRQPLVESNKYNKLVRKEAYKLSEQLGPSIRRTELASAIQDLVDYCQATLAQAKRLESLQELVSHFGLVLPCPIEEIAPSVIKVLGEGIRQAKQEGVISFGDMLWLPHIWGLQPRTYDWVFVDECQDLNTAQLEMVLKLRAAVGNPWPGRMIFVGDPRQAIYGFSGADAESYQNIQARTGATEFPLSVSYRCPVLIVREAQQIVPAIQPRKDAPLGTVRFISETTLYSEVKEGDLLLCRTTAPLISTCLDLIRMKVPARVRGKDIGRMLTKTVQLVSERRGFEFVQFPKFLREHTDAQVNKLVGDEDKQGQIERLFDIDAALAACFQGLGSHDVQEFCEDIQALFSDDRPGVWLSTVHKAKGLEASRVFILRPDKLPLVWKGQQTWEHEQELNLRYVAVTRSLDELVYVRQAGESL